MYSTDLVVTCCSTIDSNMALLFNLKDYTRKFCIYVLNESEVSLLYSLGWKLEYSTFKQIDKANSFIKLDSWFPQPKACAAAT